MTNISTNLTILSHGRHNPSHFKNGFNNMEIEFSEHEAIVELATLKEMVREITFLYEEFLTKIGSLLSRVFL